MHFWEDDWFKKNGDDLYNAIDFIETYLRKHGIGVCGKEKYGTYRDEFLHFWDGGLYTAIFGYRCYIGTFNKYPKWLENIVNKIHHFIYFTLDRCVIRPFTNFTKIHKLVFNYQAKHYNKAFQLACKKWPNVTDELIVMVNGYQLIKPCKWGNVDGEEIHKKYWKSI